jgi:hypothetical protein
VTHQHGCQQEQEPASTHPHTNNRRTMPLHHRNDLRVCARRITKRVCHTQRGWLQKGEPSFTTYLSVARVYTTPSPLPPTSGFDSSSPS